MTRTAGFDIRTESISTPNLWWSRADLGFFGWIGRQIPMDREETLVNVVVTRRT